MQAHASMLGSSLADAATVRSQLNGYATLDEVRSWVTQKLNSQNINGRINTLNNEANAKVRLARSHLVYACTNQSNIPYDTAKSGTDCRPHQFEVLPVSADCEDSPRGRPSTAHPVVGRHSQNPSRAGTGAGKILATAAGAKQTALAPQLSLQQLKALRETCGHTHGPHFQEPAQADSLPR